MTPTLQNPIEQLPQNGVSVSGVEMSPLEKLRALKLPKTTELQNELVETPDLEIDQLDTINELPASDFNIPFTPPTLSPQIKINESVSPFDKLDPILSSEPIIEQPELVEKPINPFFDLQPQTIKQEQLPIIENPEMILEQPQSTSEVSLTPKPTNILPLPESTNNIKPFARKSIETKPKEPALIKKGSVIDGAFPLEKSLIEQLGAHTNKR